MSGSVITPWGGHRTRCWCCCCCCCTLNSIKTFFNQLIMVKNITEQKMKLLWCLETDIHLEWVLEHVVGIAVDVGLLLSNKTSFYHRFMIIFCFMGQKHVVFVIFTQKIMRFCVSKNDSKRVIFPNFEHLGLPEYALKR